MSRACQFAVLAISAWVVPGAAVAQVKYDKKWSYNPKAEYYYKKCQFPKGGFQYLILDPDDSQWVYWYNPTGGPDKKGVYWCRCPTIRHPKFGKAIQQGKDLFQEATVKSQSRDELEFPDPGPKGENFTKGKAKDKDGSPVNLQCPDPELPPGLPPT